MSQAGIVKIQGSQPTVPTSFVTDNGTAIPAANILNVFGGDDGGVATVNSTSNNANGIFTEAYANNSNNLYVALSNRLTGSGSTVGAVNTNLVTFSLGATPATYVIEANFCAFEPTTPAGAGYSLFGTVRTDGATATLVGTPDKINNEEAALTSCTSDIVVSGNNVILRVTGTAGLTVDWNVVGYYTKVT